MKTFEANEELSKILIKNNFVELSSEIDIKKGKKQFGLSKFSKKKIYFDFINIAVYDGSHGQDEKYKLNENDLKILILYFKLKPSDLKELTRGLTFEFGKAIERFNELKEELVDLKRLSPKKPRIGKLERIIKTYNEIKL